LTDFATFHAAAALAGELHDKLGTIRAAAAKDGKLTLTDMENIIMAESSMARVLNRLMRLTRASANAEALSLAAE
jgi:hypothetical protein